MLNENERQRAWREAAGEVFSELSAQKEAPKSAPVSEDETTSVYTKPNLFEVLSVANPGREKLILGVSEDKPVFLNLSKPETGSILVSGDDAARTRFMLGHLARVISETKSPGDVRFSVLTATPQNWPNFNSANFEGTHKVWETGVEGFVLSLGAWAFGRNRDKHYHVLLVDDLGVVGRMNFEAIQNLRTLIEDGPARRLWTIAGIRPSYAKEAYAWVEAFKTKIFSPISSRSTARAVDGLGIATKLTDPDEFVVKSPSAEKRFFIPR